MLIINKHFNFCCFRALAYTTLDRLCAVFLYNICCFNKVCYIRLISKLHSYGINKTTVKWIQDFLSGRRFRVKVNLSYSLWNLLTSGIPQSSVLNPILFLIFINDLIKCCIARSEVYLFADDAKLFKHILSESDEQQLQEGINELHVWTKNWLLNLNISNVR